MTQRNPKEKDFHWLGRPRFICLVLAFFTLVLFWPVHGFEFLNYDDTAYVTSNRHVLTGLNPENIRWAFLSVDTGNWHPLTWLSHMLDASLFGPSPAGPHVVNLLLHVLNTVLVFLLLHGLTQARWRSALVAALFAWHPLHVESVAWISERKDVLSAFFGLLTLLMYSRYAQGSRGIKVEDRGKTLTPSLSHPMGEGARRAGEGSPSTISSLDRRLSTLDYTVSLVCFGLGLMSKPMLVSIPFVLLLLDYWPLGRLSLAQPSFAAKEIPRLVLEKIPFFVLSALSCIVTFLAQQKGGAVMTVKGLSVPLRLENAFVACMHYLGKLFWPVNLVVPYPHPGQWPWVSIVCGIALVLGLSAAAVRLRRAWPFLFTGWFWFAGMLIPVIGLVQVGTQSMADRYTYLPLVGLLIAFSWGAAAAAKSLQLPSGARWLAAVILAGMCAAGTSSQLPYWRDSGSLFSHALEASTDNYVAHDNLSAFLYRQGDVDGAMEHCYQAMQIQPNDAVAHLNMGHGLFLKGRFSEAIESFHRAIELNPRYASAWSNLGSVFLEEKDYDAAFECYQSALRLQPEDAETLNDLGGLFLLRKEFKEAINCFERALRFQPEHVRAHVNLANALGETGNTNGAIENFRTALRLNPEDPVVHLFLARLLADSGRIEEGIAEYQEALRINPQFAQARAGLAGALEAKRKLEAPTGPGERK